MTIISQAAVTEAMEVLVNVAGKDTCLDMDARNFIENLVKRKLANLGYYCQYSGGWLQINNIVSLQGFRLDFYQGTKACFQAIENALIARGFTTIDLSDFKKYLPHFSNFHYRSIERKGDTITMKNSPDPLDLLHVCLFALTLSSPGQVWKKIFDLRNEMRGETYKFLPPNPNPLSLQPLKFRFYKNGKTKVTFPSEAAAKTFEVFYNEMKALYLRFRNTH